MHRQDLQTNSDSTETESFNQSNLNSGEIINSEIDQRFPERLSKEHINTLPILSFEGKIHLITESKDVSEAIKILRQEPVLGFDTETRPTFKKGDQYSVSLLQLSTREEAFLFRLNYLGLPEELASLLADPDILKVGVAILDDIRALQKLRKFDVICRPDLIPEGTRVINALQIGRALTGEMDLDIPIKSMIVVRFHSSRPIN